MIVNEYMGGLVCVDWLIQLIYPPYIMNHTEPNDLAIMFIIMIFSSLLSTMNVWADRMDDMRFSINDIYMALLMSGWMFLFMGLFYGMKHLIIIGVVSVSGIILCIRTQFNVTETQYKYGMIPHHSMAVHMSRKLLEKENDISPFVKNIISTQEKEIAFLKK